MPKEDFVHLHVHSDYSLLDGCSSVDKLCQKAAHMGQTAIALTDHGVLFGLADFFKKAEDNGVKPLLGCEIYLVYEDELGRDNAAKAKQKAYHMGLIARNFKGYQNLVGLVSLAHTHGFYRKPRVAMGQLAEHAEGLIGFSGCLAAVIPRFLQADNYDAAKEACGRFVDIFGKENFFIELMDHGIDLQENIIPNLLKLAKEFGLKTVATNDVHYVEKSDSKAHESLLCIQTGSKLSDAKRMRYTSNEFYLKSKKQMAQKMDSHDPNCLKNTMAVAEMCELKLPFGENHYPIFEKSIEVQLPKKNEDFERVMNRFLQEQNTLLKRENKPLVEFDKKTRLKLAENGAYLLELCKAGLKQRYGIDYKTPQPEDADGDGDGGKPNERGDGKGDKAAAKPTHNAKQNHGDAHAKELCSRLEHELAIIIGAGFADYFLIVWDLIRWARDQGIPVGPGRGSGAGCLVAYVLNITDIEPLRFGLLFERMLNLERVSPPDFDIDFCVRRRDEVVEYVREKYGREHVANIITFGTFGAKMIVRDLARINDLSFAEADRIAKMIPDTLNISLEDAEAGSVELQEEIKKNPLTKSMMEQGKVIEGMIRNSGKHACGIIIADRPLTDLIPVTVQEGDLTTQYPKGPSEDLGLLKMDFLGLKTLTVINDAQLNVRHDRDSNFDIEKLPLDDAKTFELLKRSETIGVFQLESPGMQALCRQMEVSNFEEIIALIALYRPGPMQFIPQYIKGKQDPASIAVAHPILEAIARETHGVLVYQEQVMEAAQRIAGYSLGGADILRRAMGKKIWEVMNAQKAIFVEGARKTHKIPKAQAEKIFGILERFAEYGFNKSHSAAYAMLSYRTAFLKANYPTEFMAALLSNELGSADKVSHFVAEAKRMGIEVLGPHINESRKDFTPLADAENPERPKRIRFGIAAIKGVGDIAAKQILEQRDKDGPFKDFRDYVLRVDSHVCNRRAAEGLICSGAFDGDGIDRRHLLNSCEAILNEAQDFQRDKRNGQTQLFELSEVSAGSRAGPSAYRTDEPIMTEAEKLEHERELLGFYLSGHPMEAFGDFELIGQLNHLPDEAAARAKGRMAFRLSGAVNDVVKRITRQSKKPWAFFNLSTPDGHYRINAFSEAYGKYLDLLEEGRLVTIEGEVRYRADRDEVSLNVQGIQDFEAAFPNLIESVTLCVENRSDELEHLAKNLAACLHQQKSGGTQVQLEIRLDTKRAVLTELPESMGCSLKPELLRELGEQAGVHGTKLKTTKPKLLKQSWGQKNASQT